MAVGGIHIGPFLPRHLFHRYSWFDDLDGCQYFMTATDCRLTDGPLQCRPQDIYMVKEKCVISLHFLPKLVWVLGFSNM